MKWTPGKMELEYVTLPIDSLNLKFLWRQLSPYEAPWQASEVAMWLLIKDTEHGFANRSEALELHIKALAMKRWNEFLMTLTNEEAETLGPIKEISIHEAHIVRKNP